MSLVLEEATAPRIREILVEYEVVVAAAIAEVEAKAGLARARKGRRLTTRTEREAWGRFGQIWSTAAILDVDRTLLASATDLAGRRHLRGYDAVQLAGALRAADVTGATGFVCLDRELNEAATSEGLTCLMT